MSFVREQEFGSDPVNVRIFGDFQEEFQSEEPDFFIHVAEKYSE